MPEPQRLHFLLEHCPQWRFSMVYLGQSRSSVMSNPSSSHFDTLSAKAQLYCHDLCVCLHYFDLFWTCIWIKEWSVSPCFFVTLDCQACAGRWPLHCVSSAHVWGCRWQGAPFLEGSLHSKSAQRVQSSNLLKLQLVMLCFFKLDSHFFATWIKDVGNCVVLVEELMLQRIGTLTITWFGLCAPNWPYMNKQIWIYMYIYIHIHISHWIYVHIYIHIDICMRVSGWIVWAEEVATDTFIYTWMQEIR